ncbi:carboxylesterase/lipase family protein [Novosphingobium sp. 9U]|uniref:carboxylesterase/lipase family protein n=1 Tax=Novosphingobium sp. 9U TaxID=2653158 RepID=UPI0012F2086F|nr:carboxylesterase family protein [Novosphingobium sp. 9U]VWX54121.1 Carboxylesterase [Novosphingobium sp. 9U]
MTRETEVTIPAGTLRGSAAGGIRTFLGVPYAAPPVGERRFAVPQPAPAWDGVREATTSGPNAPQRVREMPGLELHPLVGHGWVPGDDYLTLNVWAPENASECPVMVFIHGGAFLLGSKDASVSDGTAFARDGIVCVAINYRMGVDGFLPIPGVPTNLGLRDQIAALTWVRDTIAAFGGDPGNVTVFGESAGAMSIGDLVTAPRAQGLFRRAIIQSGHGAMTRDVGIARKLVTKLASLLGISPTRDGFAAVTPEATFDAIEKVSAPTARIDLRDPTGREPVFGISRFVPVHGDDVLPLAPLEALKQGAGAQIDVLIGSNAEEMNLYLVPTGARAKVGRLLAWLALRKSQPRAWRVLKAYGMGQRGVSPGVALNRAMNDLVFRWPARRFAEEHRGRTHMYEFDWRSPRFDGELGAAHGMELPFVFDTLETTAVPEGLTGTMPPQDLADRIHAIWVRYATDGTLSWPEFTREQRNVFQLAADRTIHEPPMPAAPFLP